MAKKTKKGSILAYSLIIISMMLAIAGSLSVVSIIEKKAASGTDFSMQSLQVADSGAQIATNKIEAEATKVTSGSILTAMGSCVSGKYTGIDAGPAGSQYEITFLDSGMLPLTCDKAADLVAGIKSVGTYKNTVRAIQVAVVSKKQVRIGVFRAGATFGEWYLDKNGDGEWHAADDPKYLFGNPTDKPVVGDWNGDGKDEIGVLQGTTWYFDMNGNGVWDGNDPDASFTDVFPGSNHIPVAGDWNDDGVDEIGVFIKSGANFYLDKNNDHVWNDGSPFVYGSAVSTPVAGDWNDDGKDEIGIYRTDNFRWRLDTNGSESWADDPISNPFGVSGDRPVVGDWNGDGKDEIGVIHDTGVTSAWYLDRNGNSVSDVDDTTYNFGTTNDIPVSGRW